MIEVKNVIKKQNKTWKKQRQRKKRTRTLEIYATASKDGVWEIIYDITDEQVVNIPATIQDQARSTDDSRNSPQPLLVASSRVRAKKKRSQRFQDAPDPGGHSKRSGRLRRSTTPDSKSGFLKSALARRRWTTNLKTCRQIWKMLENISSNGGGATFERRKKRRPWAPLVDTWNRTLVSPSRKVVVFLGERPRERNGPQQQRGAAAG